MNQFSLYFPYALGAEIGPMCLIGQIYGDICLSRQPVLDFVVEGEGERDKGKQVKKETEREKNKQANCSVVPEVWKFEI